MGNQIGEYVDPNVMNPDGSIIPINPSWGVGIMGFKEIPMMDGTTVVVDQDGMIVDTIDNMP